MRVPSYVSLSRHGIYYFRLYVPEHLRAITGNRINIRKSLHTGNAQEAIRLARRLVAQYHEAFTSYARIGMAIKPNSDDNTHLLAEIDVSKGVFRLDYDQNNPDEVSNAERILTRSPPHKPSSPSDSTYPLPSTKKQRWRHVLKRHQCIY